MDGIKSLSPEARIHLARQLKLRSQPTRRVWIPKPPSVPPTRGDERGVRPLGIPTIYDRALQGVVKTALEPEWEALFEPSSCGFRPGRSCHDAIKHIKDAIKAKANLARKLVTNIKKVSHASSGNIICFLCIVTICNAYFCQNRNRNC